MRCVPALFEVKNVCESRYSAMTAATLPGLTRPAPIAVRAPLIAFSYSAMKTRRPGQAVERHARISGAAEVAVWEASLFIGPGSMHVLRLFHFHCLVSFVRNSSSGHGLFASVGLVSSKWMVWPSGVVMLVTALPVFSARSMSVAILGLRGFCWRRDRGGIGCAAAGLIWSQIVSKAVNSRSQRRRSCSVQVTTPAAALRA